jgi:hypothetical protein
MRKLGKKKAAGAPTPTAKLINFNTPAVLSAIRMRQTTAVHPYMKTRTFVAVFMGLDSRVLAVFKKISKTRNDLSTVDGAEGGLLFAGWRR